MSNHNFDLPEAVSLEDLLEQEDDHQESLQPEDALKEQSMISLLNINFAQPTFDPQVQAVFEIPSLLNGTLCIIANQLPAESKTESLLEAVAEAHAARNRILGSSLQIMHNPALLSDPENPLSKTSAAAAPAQKRLLEVLFSFPAGTNSSDIVLLVDELLGLAVEASRKIAFLHSQRQSSPLKVSKGESQELLDFVRSNSQVEVLFDRSDSAYAGLTELALLATSGASVDAAELETLLEHLRTLRDSLKQLLPAAVQ